MRELTFSEVVSEIEQIVQPLGFRVERAVREELEGLSDPFKNIPADSYEELRINIVRRVKMAKTKAKSLGALKLPKGINNQKQQETLKWGKITPEEFRKICRLCI